MVSIAISRFQPGGHIVGHIVGTFSVFVKTDGSFAAIIICIENLSVDNQNVSYPLIICLPNYMTLHVQRMLSTLAARPNRK